MYVHRNGYFESEREKKAAGLSRKQEKKEAAIVFV